LFYACNNNPGITKPVAEKTAQEIRKLRGAQLRNRKKKMGKTWEIAMEWLLKKKLLN
jgi:hypothetical protein